MTDAELSVTGDGSPTVPVYNCRVFVRSIDGKCSARVANLADIHVTAANERAALGEIVKTFKSQVIELSQAGSIPWLKPELTMEDDEVERLIPVHL